MTYTAIGATIRAKDSIGDFEDEKALSMTVFIISLLTLVCQQSDNNLAAGDTKTVELAKSVAGTVDPTFGGWKDFAYWEYIEADYTKTEIKIEPLRGCVP